MPPLARTILLIGLLCLVVGAAAPAHAQISDELREALQPKDQRWQYYPPQVTNVLFSPDGKPWLQLWTARTPSIDAIKRMVERGASSDRAVGWVENVHMLMIDSRGRIWLRVSPPHKSTYILRYDPDADQWLRRAGFTNPFNMEHIYESADGTIFIPDYGTMYVVHDDEWRHRKLYELPAPNGPDKGRRFQHARFAEDEQGRVYVWSRRGHFSDYSVGYFIWADGKWRRRMLHYTEIAIDTTDSQWKDVRNVAAVKHAVRDIVPLTDGRVFVSTHQGVCYIDRPFPDSKPKQNVNLPRHIQTLVAQLNAPDWRTREQATVKLRALGKSALNDVLKARTGVSDPEVQCRLDRVIEQIKKQDGGEPFDFEPPRVDGAVVKGAQLEGFDAAGNAWLYVDSVKRPDMREPAHRRLWRMTPEGELLRAPDKAADMRVRSLFAAPDGRVFLTSHSSKGRAGVVLKDGRALPPDEMMRQARQIYGISRAGRTFIQRDGHKIYSQPLIAAHNPDAPDTRKTLPAKHYKLGPNGGVDAFGAHGNLWAELHTDDGDTVLHEYRDGQWHANDPRKAREAREKNYYITALPDNMVLLHRGDDEPAYLYDGDTWHQHDSTRRMIEQHYDMLVDRLDHRQNIRQFHIDRADRIWLNFQKRDVAFDGERWIKQAAQDSRHARVHWREYLVGPMPDGKGMLVRNVEGGPKHNGTLTHWRTAHPGGFDVTKLKMPQGLRLHEDNAERPGTWLDRNGRIWLVAHDDTAGMVDQRGAHLIENVGRPRYEDSEGGVWFVRSGRRLSYGTRRLVLLDPDGRRATLEMPWLTENSKVREDAHGRVWVTSPRGLYQIAVRRNDDALRLEKVARYERGALQSAYTRIFIRNNALWLSYNHLPSPIDRLTRVQLPPPPDRLAPPPTAGSAHIP